MEFVNVAIRIKPSSIDDESKSLQKISEDPPTVYITDRRQTYSFDILPIVAKLILLIKYSIKKRTRMKFLLVL
ncbi:hypothetical protein QE152_g13236 [Popillia japonica]|uniref:Kinesin motor domain-containing protein n=1 Tax=Popillia japonica TaxID=7064 RepID=A0AAW1LDR4_POPJA